jgi:hypothetical protein
MQAAERDLEDLAANLAERRNDRSSPRAVYNINAEDLSRQSILASPGF